MESETQLALPQERKRAKTNGATTMRRRFKADDTVEVLKGISPVAWQYVNLFGRFEFNKRGKVDLAALLKVFDEPECWNRITQEKTEED
jgi:hypothetical protein